MMQPDVDCNPWSTDLGFRDRTPKILNPLSALLIQEIEAGPVLNLLS